MSLLEVISPDHLKQNPVGALVSLTLLLIPAHLTMNVAGRHAAMSQPVIKKKLSLDFKILYRKKKKNMMDITYMFTKILDLQ